MHVYQPVSLDSSDPDIVSATASETLIFEESDFLIEVLLPVPLQDGCKVELTIPAPLGIGPELTEIEVEGQFGARRLARFTIDANLNLITILDACTQYHHNVAPATFRIKSLVNPKYVMTSESFYVEFSDINGNAIAKTTGGLTYTTTPGTIYAQEFDWFPSDYLISAPSEINFLLQPEHLTETEDVMISITMPKEDFETLPDACIMEFYNGLIDPSTFECAVNAETNTFEMKKVLREPYRFNSESIIEFSLLDIIMPSSSRPTGTYQIDFFTMIGEQYMLVDTVQVFDKIRGIPGVLYSLDVVPMLNETYVEDTFDISFKAAHTILQGGFIEVEIP